MGNSSKFIFVSVLLLLFFAYQPSKSDACLTVVGKAAKKYSQTFNFVQQSSVLGLAYYNPHDETNIKKAISEILPEIQNGPTKAKLTKMKNFNCESDSSPITCIFNILNDTKGILVESIENLEVVSSSRLRSELESLKENLDASENATQVVLETVFQVAAEEMQEKWRGLAAKVGSGKLDDIIPEKMAVLDRISFVLTKMGFDFEEGKYKPEYILLTRGSDENIRSIQDTLMDIHRFMLIPQQMFEGNNLLSYLMSQSCLMVQNEKYNCFYHECDTNEVESKVQYLLNAQEIGYEWMTILSVFACQRQSTTASRCLTGNLVASIENEMGKTLKSQREAWSLLLKQNAERKESCNCQLGEFKTFQKNETEIRCEKCPFGTYNLVIGSQSCKKCPDVLAKSDESFKQCLNSKIGKLGESIRRQETKQKNNEELIDEMKEEMDNFGKGEDEGTNFVLKHKWRKIQRRGMGTRYSDGMFGNGQSQWVDFKNGFGTPSSDEFWLGLEKIHQLTQYGDWELMFKAKWSNLRRSNNEQKWGFAVYSNFTVGDELSQYELGIGRKSTSNFFGQRWNDHFVQLNGSPFITSDRDQGRRIKTVRGAWWFNNRNFYHTCFNCMDSDGNVWLADSNWLIADVTEMYMRNVYESE